MHQAVTVIHKSNDENINKSLKSIIAKGLASTFKYMQLVECFTTKFRNVFGPFWTICIHANGAYQADRSSLFIIYSYTFKRYFRQLLQVAQALSF